MPIPINQINEDFLQNFRHQCARTMALWVWPPGHFEASFLSCAVKWAFRCLSIFLVACLLEGLVGGLARGALEPSSPIMGAVET